MTQMVSAQDKSNRIGEFRVLQADLYEMVRDQLALDLGCDPALLDTPENVVVEIGRAHV